NSCIGKTQNLNHQEIIQRFKNDFTIRVFRDSEVNSPYSELNTYLKDLYYNYFIKLRKRAKYAVNEQQRKRILEKVFANFERVVSGMGRKIDKPKDLSEPIIIIWPLEKCISVTPPFFVSIEPKSVKSVIDGGVLVSKF